MAQLKGSSGLQRNNSEAPFSLRHFRALAAELMAEDPSLAASLADASSPRAPQSIRSVPPPQPQQPQPPQPAAAASGGGAAAKLKAAPGLSRYANIPEDDGGEGQGEEGGSGQQANGGLVTANGLGGVAKLQRAGSGNNASGVGQMGAGGFGGGEVARPPSAHLRPLERTTSAASERIMAMEKGGGGRLEKSLLSSASFREHGEVARDGGRGGGLSILDPSLVAEPMSVRRAPIMGSRQVSVGESDSATPAMPPWSSSVAGSAVSTLTTESGGRGGGGSEVMTMDDADSGLPAAAAAKARGDKPKDKSYFQKAEETYSLQVAVALRLIADSEMAEETEMATPIVNPKDAAKGPVFGNPMTPRSQAEATAYRFWVNGTLTYEDRVEDGFYDIWGIQPFVYAMCIDSSARGRMPPLDVLRSLHPSEAAFDVTLINRTIDFELKALEDEAVGLAYAATEVKTLAEKLGALVAKHMGGPTTSEKDELTTRFRQRGWEIKSYLKTSVLPIGRLPVGLCRHRALLFKVLADALGMPCRIARGCRFCKMDDGASCLVLAGDEREYVVDLLEKPGSLYTLDPNSDDASMKIFSPLRCPEVKSLALTDPGDGTGPAWIPDFRRKDAAEDAEYAARLNLGRDGVPPLVKARRAAAKAAKLKQQEEEEEEEDDDDDEDEEPQSEKKPKKAAKKKKAKENGAAGKKAEASAAAPSVADMPVEEKGVEFMDVLTDGRIMNIGEAEIDWDDITTGERVGAGSFGTVYRGEWAGSDVAVKVLINQDLQEEQLDEFKREVVIMRRLRHPNIVLFMGAVTKPPHLSIVTEFLARGSLFRLLHKPGAKESLKEERRMRMAVDIARGINYLHHCNPVIVHRDLKTPNLLVDKNFTVKVADFGLSRNKNATFLSSKSGAGTPEWMAPEVLRNEPSDEKSDVYSFGVILWELATLEQPWDGMNPMQVVGAVGFNNQRLTIPDDMSPDLKELIASCWHDDPKDRPNFNQIMAKLKPIVQKVASQSKA